MSGVAVKMQLARGVVVVGLAALCGAGVIRAQGSAPVDWLSLVEHETGRPNYMSGLEPSLPDAIALPPPPLGEAPAVVRAVYGNAWVFGSARFYDLVRLADTTEANARIRRLAPMAIVVGTVER